jgi:para-nitrobenzyl esterase
MRLEKLKLMCRGLAVLSLASSSLAQAQLPELEDIPNAPVVWLPSGAVRGSGSDVLSFKAIPYAQAPVGNLRWRPPVDAKPWGGILDGASFGPACIQAGDIRKSEDCLFVNVWAPKDAIATRKKLPVMVWVYGGSFHQGSGNIDGSFLAQRGVVVVSMNYRVSTLGFLAHPQLSAESPEKVSGNYGILDIAQSLKWVNANIDRFGGDPTRVTIWGQSSGASAITSLMASPKSKGLFDRAILQSPGAFRHWKSLKQGEEDGSLLGADLVALRALPENKVPVIQNTGGGTAIRELSEPRVIGPVADGVVLPHEERTTFEAGNMAQVGVLVGSNNDEGVAFTEKYPITTVDQYRKYLTDPKIFGSYGVEALAVYPVNADAQVKRAISMGFGDSQFWLGTRGVARAATRSGLPSYRYFFTRKENGGTGQDARHGAEIPYVMGSIKLTSAPYTADDVKISTAMGDAWIRFASTGNPNGGVINNWPAYDLVDEKVFVFDAQFGILNGPRNTELDFIGKFDSSIPAK